MGSLRLKTTLQARGPAAAVVLDDEQVATIGEGAKRFPVAATIGDYTWRTTVTRMGGEFLLGMNKDVRKGAGAEAGDTVDVLIELDDAPRELEVPEALSAALAGDPVAKAKYDALAYTHRKSSRGGSRRPRRRRPASGGSSRCSRCSGRAGRGA